MYMYIKYKLTDLVYDFVHAKICTHKQVHYSFIRKCSADIGHRTFEYHLYFIISVAYQEIGFLFVIEYVNMFFFCL